MSAQRSNRSQLIEGTLRCLGRLPPERITARAIVAESGTNLGSITYHFGSKDKLVTEAAILGLNRWLTEIDRGLGGQSGLSPAARFRRLAEVFESSRHRHAGLARNFIGALAKAQHDPRLRGLLAAGFRRSRPNVAAVLQLGEDQTANDAAGLVLAMFHAREPRSRTAAETLPTFFPGRLGLRSSRRLFTAPQTAAPRPERARADSSFRYTGHGLLRTCVLDRQSDLSRGNETLVVRSAEQWFRDHGRVQAGARAAERSARPPRRASDDGGSSQHSASPGFPGHRMTAPSGVLRTWLNSWAGIGHVAVGVHR